MRIATSLDQPSLAVLCRFANEIRTDAPIDEIRELRRSISARFDHDPARLVAYYTKLQEQYRDRLIDTAKTTETKDQTAA